MMSKKLGVFSLITAAALVSGALVGCGGSSATVGTSQPITVTGGVVTNVGGLASGQSAVGTSTSPQQIQVTTSGGATVSGTVPPGTPPIGATSTVGVIPSNQPFFSSGGFAAVKAKAPTAHPVNISYDQGHTWVWSGVNVNPDLSLDGNLILLAGTSPWLQLPGAYAFVGGIHQLTVQTFVFGLHVDVNGIVSLPTSDTLKLPYNGGITAGGYFASVTLPSAFVSGQVNLTITGLTSGTKTQSKNIASNTVTFSDPNSDSKDGVPGTGVDTVSVVVSANGGGQ